LSVIVLFDGLRFVGFLNCPQNNFKNIFLPIRLRSGEALRVNDKHSIKFNGTKITSDVGLLAYGELDEAIELTVTIGSKFCDNWKGKKIQHSIVTLLRQSMFSSLAGYEDTNDTESLSIDPTLRQVACSRARGRTAALTSPIGRF